MKNPILSPLFAAVLTSFLATAALAQNRPSLPRDPPQDDVVDEGLVLKNAEALMKSCRSAKERELKGQGLKGSSVGERAKSVCFCIAKDIKRRDDVKEMGFITTYLKDQFDDDHVYTEEQDLWLHEFGKTEKNCTLNPKYRFGQPEPRLPAAPALQNATSRGQTTPQRTESKNEKRKSTRQK